MFYDRFKELCLANKTSVSKAATDIGLSNSTPTKWKNTGATPDSATLSKISNYFGVSINQLLGTPVLGRGLMKIISEESLRLQVPEEELTQIFLNRRVNDITVLNKENISKYFDSVCTEKAPIPEDERKSELIDSGFFRVMQSAKEKGYTSEDMQLALDFLDRARKRDQE